MREAYLEVTYRHGRPIAAYYYLPRAHGASSHTTRRAEQGMLVDLDQSGKPIGIEITAPSHVSLTSINKLLEELGQEPLTESDLIPLLAA